MKRTLIALSALAVAAIAAPAFAQADPVIEAARAAGQVGEQFDGYLGFVPGASISADLRGRVDQNNMRRRQLYTQRASSRNASVAEVATAVACEIFSDPEKISVGERYRDQAGQWRQRTASQPVDVPAICRAPAAN
ncbi:MAG: YdbL family protein [Hyphomonadaceae bacterium]